MDNNIDMEFINSIIEYGQLVKQKKLDKRQMIRRYIYDNVIYLVSFMDKTPIDIEIVEYE